MKPEIRQQLARLSFEEKIRKVSELLQLSRELKAQRIRQSAERVRNVGEHEMKRERSGR